ncbi:MAG: heavy-metal-associated domain-containing protein [Bacteroidota bacterium]|jgi:copper chaperone|nr:heavy-metal-associated domain-containing protein [Bacteroidota bacterium]
MKTLKFKTNIKCTGCVAKVTPFLNDEKGIEKWDVDIFNPEKILSVETDSINSDKIIEAIEKAGFKAEKTS